MIKVAKAQLELKETKVQLDQQDPMAKLDLSGLLGQPDHKDQEAMLEHKELLV